MTAGSGGEDIFLRLGLDASDVILEAQKLANQLEQIKAQYRSVAQVTRTFDNAGNLAKVTIEGISAASKKLTTELKFSGNEFKSAATKITDSAKSAEASVRNLAEAQRTLSTRAGQPIDRERPQRDITRELSVQEAGLSTEALAKLQEKQAIESNIAATKAVQLRRDQELKALREAIVQRAKEQAAIEKDRSALVKIKEQQAAENNITATKAAQIERERELAALKSAIISRAEKQAAIERDRSALTKLKEQQAIESNIGQVKAQQIARERELKALKEAIISRTREQARLEQQARASLTSTARQGVSVVAQGDNPELIANAQRTANKLREEGIAAIRREQRETAALADARNRAANINAEQLRRRQALQAQLNREIAKEKALQGQNAAAALRTGKQTERSLSGISAKAKEAQKNTEGLVLSFRSLSRLAALQLVSRAFGLLSDAIRGAIDDARAFTIAVAEIQSISQNNAIATETWANGLRQLSDEFSLDVLEQAEAAYQALSNQVVDSTTAFQFLREANLLATAAVATTSEAVSILSATINAFGLNVEDSNEISASFFKTVELGRLRLSDISQTFGRVAVLANELGVSLNETQAGLTLLTRQGVPAAEAQTFLRNVFLKLLRPTEALKARFEELGVASGQEAVEVFGLVGLFEKLEQTTNGNASEIANLFGRIRAIVPALKFASEASNQFASDLEQISSAGETFNKAIEGILESPGKRLEVELSKVRNFLAVDFGEKALGAILKVTEAVGGLSNVLITFSEVALVGAATGVGALVGALTLLAITNPVGGLVAAFGGLVVAIRAAQRAGRQAAQELVEADRNARIKIAQNARAFADESFKAITDTLDRTEKAYRRTTAEVVGELSKQQRGITTFFDDTTKDINKLLDASLKAIEDQVKTVEDTLESAKDVVKDINAELRELAEDRQAIDFNIDFSEAEGAAEQIRLLDKRIRELSREDFDLGGEAGREAFERASNELIKLTDQRGKLQLQTQRDNRKLLEENAEIEQKIAERRQKSIEKIAEIEAKRRSARRDPSDDAGTQAQKLQTLARSAAKERRDAELDIQKLRQEIAENVRDVENITIKDRKQAAREALDFRIEGLRKVAEIEKQIAKQAEEDLAKLRRDRIALEESVRTFRGFDPSAITSISGDVSLDPEERIEQIRRLLSIQAEASRAVLANAREEGTSAEQLARLRKTALEQQRFGILEIEKVQRRASADAVTASREQAETDIEALKDRVASVKEFSDLNQRAIDNLRQLDRQQFAQTFLPDAGELRVIAQNFGDVPADAAGLESLEEDFLRFQSTLRDFDVSKSVESFQALQKVLLDLKQTRGFFTTSNLADDITLSSAALQEAFQRTQSVQTVLTRGGTETGLQNVRNRIAELEQSLDATANATNVVDKTTQEVVNSLNNSWEKATASVQAYQQALRDASQEVEQRRLDIVPIPSGPPQGRQSGGVVQYFANGGTPRGTDTVPAMLTPGEFVVNARSSRKFFSQLLAINSGITPRFESGGSVTNVGDININASTTGDTATDVREIGRLLRREIRRGTLKL